MSSAQVMTGHSSSVPEPIQAQGQNGPSILENNPASEDTSMDQDSSNDDNELVPFLWKSCSPKGFLSGERVLTPKGPATVVGVNGGFLWFKMDGDKGASYWNNGCTHEDLLRLGIQPLNPNQAYDPKKQFRGLKRPNPKSSALPYIVESSSAESQTQLQKDYDKLKEEVSKLKGFGLEGMDFHELEALERTTRESHEKIRAALLERLEDKMKNFMCVVCMDAPYNVCCLPCGHVSLCVGCSFKIGIGGQCPTCRKTIDQLCKVYLTSS